MNRPLPYEIVFSDEAFEATHFPEIRAEAEHVQARTSEPIRFLHLPAVAPLLREVVESSDHSATEEFGPVLFQGYHFWRYGKEVFSFEEPLLRELLSSQATIAAGELVPPKPAGYLQLPPRLLWARVAQDAQAEPIDGVFWTMVGWNDEAVPPFTRLDLLVVLGLMNERPGFSIAEIQAPLEIEAPATWASGPAREEGVDFANILPGGELNNYLGIETAGEVLKLTARCFRYLTEHPESWDG